MGMPFSVPVIQNPQITRPLCDNLLLVEEVFATIIVGIIILGVLMIMTAFRMDKSAAQNPQPVGRKERFEKFLDEVNKEYPVLS
jgi:hypothetical protein